VRVRSRTQVGCFLGLLRCSMKGLEEKQRASSSAATNDDSRVRATYTRVNDAEWCRLCGRMWKTWIEFARPARGATHRVMVDNVKGFNSLPSSGSFAAWLPRAPRLRVG